MGLTAVKYWLDKYPDSIDQRFLCKFILEATKFILENNTFQFSDKYYFQISGTYICNINHGFPRGRDIKPKISAR